MRTLAPLLSVTALSLMLWGFTTTHTALDCYQFGSFDEAQAAYEADQTSVNPTLTYLDDDRDGLICECLYYEEICWLPSDDQPATAILP